VLWVGCDHILLVRPSTRVFTGSNVVFLLVFAPCKRDFCVVLSWVEMLGDFCRVARVSSTDKRNARCKGPGNLPLELVRASSNARRVSQQPRCSLGLRFAPHRRPRLSNIDLVPSRRFPDTRHSLARFCQHQRVCRRQKPSHHHQTRVRNR
jgi:hypothetical protein